MMTHKAEGDLTDSGTIYDFCDLMHEMTAFDGFSKAQVDVPLSLRNLISGNGSRLALPKLINPVHRRSWGPRDLALP